MHEAKVNTISVELPLTDKNNASRGAVPDYVGAIDVPFGMLCIQRGDALDHAYMRTRQLANLLLLIHVEGSDHFNRLGNGSKDAILGLAWQLADEMESLVPILASDLAGSKA